MARDFAKSFYNSEAWRRVSTAYMSSKLYICERCGKPAVICHHRKWLKPNNINDPNIALNPNNLEALCIDCHNEEHMSDHGITLFNDDGSIARVKPNKETRAYQEAAANIDETLAKARALLSVGSCRKTRV